MTSPTFSARRFAVPVAVLAAFVLATRLSAQTPFWDQPQTTPTPAPSPTVPRTAPPQQQNPAPQQAPPQQAARPVAAPPSPVIARVNGRPITEAQFDNVANPYFARLRAQLGAGFDGDVVKIAKHNVLDELLRRELLRVEAHRLGYEPTPADIDTILARDPYFWSTGKFDRAKFELYKTSPASNYSTMLPQLRELAIMDRLDRQLRQRFTPSATEVHSEWAKRNDQIRYSYLALLQRDMSLEPEATESEVAAYYKAHPDAFMKKTRAHLRYVKLPLPDQTDSTRSKAEERATVRARAIADSLEKHTLPDTAAELTDSGPFELSSPTVPGLGFVPEISATLGRADSVASVKFVGPATGRDGVIVGVLTDREPRHVPPLHEVLGDAKRLADLDKRKTASEAERRAYYHDHLNALHTTRVTVTRALLRDAAVPSKAPTNAEIDRWYAENGRAYLHVRDSLPMPAMSDTLRARLRPAVEHALRPDQVRAVTERLAQALRTSRDPRGAVKHEGAVLETLSLVRTVTADSVFVPPMLDSLYTDALVQRGVVQGPQFLGGRWVVWRVDRADTAYVPPFEEVRSRVDAGVRAEKLVKDEADAKVWYDAHHDKYKTPVKYAIRYIAVKSVPPDSIRIGEAELRAAYQKNRDRYRQEEQVKARHILISTREPNVNEAHARERADSLLTALHKGADFVDLAKRFSQEPGAPTTGGDLGWFGRGRMVKEFEQAAFALKPGQVSGVVRTQFGFHIIKLEDHKAAGIRPFGEVRSQIRSELAQARADSSARRSAAALRRRLALGGDATALARAHGGLQTPEPFAANEPVPGLGFVEGLGADLPGVPAGRWAPKVYRNATQALVVQVERRLATHPATFDEAKTQAIDDMKNEKKEHMLEERIATVRKQLASGASLDSVAAPFGGLRDSGLLPANSTFLPMVGFAPHVAKKMYAMKKGAVSDTFQTAVGTMWVRMDEHKGAEASTFKTQREQIAGELLTNKMNDWLEQMKKTARIEVLRPDLREPKPGPYKTVTMNAGG